MVTAFGASCVFLVAYVIHKILMRGIHTPFGGEGIIRNIYCTMLISHIILAMVIVPLVLVRCIRCNPPDVGEPPHG